MTKRDAKLRRVDRDNRARLNTRSPIPLVQVNGTYLILSGNRRARAAEWLYSGQDSEILSEILLTPGPMQPTLHVSPDTQPEQDSER